MISFLKSKEYSITFSEIVTYLVNFIPTLIMMVKVVNYVGVNTKFHYGEALAGDDGNHSKELANVLVWQIFLF